MGNLLFRDQGYPLLEGRRTAVFTNPTGVFADSLMHIVDDLVTQTQRGIDVRAVLAPEHGFRGDRQAESGDPSQYVDAVTGLDVYSVYKVRGAELRTILSKTLCDTLLVDIQDAGVRLYTFVWTLLDLMQAAAELGWRIIILDKPNPLGGVAVEGPVLDMKCCTSGYGRLPVPHRHGMTVGELALFFKSSIETSVDLTVVAMKGWNRSMLWDNTGLPWFPPSPNLPTPLTCVAYAATVFLEATNATEGRGSCTPFLLFGVPAIDANALAARLNNNQTHKRFRASYFSPTFFKYNDTVVAGVQYFPQRGDSQFRVGLEILTALRDLWPLNEMPSPLTGNSMLSNSSPAEIPSLNASKGTIGLSNADTAPPNAEQKERALSNSKLVFDGVWFGHAGTILMDWYAGTPLVRELIEAGEDANTIDAVFLRESEHFKSVTRLPFLLY